MSNQAISILDNEGVKGGDLPSPNADLERIEETASARAV